MFASNSVAARVVLVAITLWGLAMVVPDIGRFWRPLASFGFYADNDGVITDVRRPFSTDSASPAWRAGLRAGDRLDLAAMRCAPLQTLRCASAEAALGALPLVVEGRRAELAIAAAPGAPARLVELVAVKNPVNWWKRLALVLDQMASIGVILAAAWLVWTRPSGMTWGFFLYAIWFNPSQSEAYYAFLQQWPAALLAQSVIGAAAQGIGYAGFLVFALRAPSNQASPRWRPLERMLPAVAIALSVLLALSYANLFGYPTEAITRAGVLSGMVIVALACVIVVTRRGEQSPADYQRLTWVLWGCLIGLPAIIFADLAQGTTMVDSLLGPGAPPQAVWRLLRLVNGILCLFVFEAIRRPQVVSVAIPLRRVTILGLLLSVPALFLHHQIDQLKEGVEHALHLPQWVWLPVGVLTLFLISRLHERATHHVDRLLNRPLAMAGRRLGQAILQARDLDALERPLVLGVCEALSLVSAGVFRKTDGRFVRGVTTANWQGAAALDADDALIRGVQSQHQLAEIDPESAGHGALPTGPAQPILAASVADRFECFAIAFYGGHTSGADLSPNERAVLVELADQAAAVCRRIEHDSLRERLAVLEGRTPVRP